MRKYFLIDLKSEKINTKILRLCDVTSRLSLIYGPPPHTDKQIHELWKFDDFPPSSLPVYKKIRHGHIKWYIGHGHVGNVFYGEWNSDFLHGLCQYGDIKWNRYSFPSFYWYGNEDLIETLKKCPFYGKLNKHALNSPNSKRYIWQDVVALYLPHKEDSLSFMAGVLATGRISELNGMSTAVYNRNVENVLKKFGIPIEAHDWGNMYVHISPIWPSLLKNYMPDFLQKWNTLKKPYKAEEYSSILWRMFFDKNPVVDALPYLPCRRTIYNKFDSIKSLERMVVSNNLVSLDRRIGEVVRQWFK